MSNLDDNESIYNDLKKFYDTHLGVLYSYQDFEIAGIREYKVILKKIRPLEDYEKNRLSNDLIKILKNIANKHEELSNIEGYLTLNPIINYYENFLIELRAVVENDKDMYIKLKELFNNMLLNSNFSEEVKLAILSSIVFDFIELESTLKIFSIHNDYVFYVVKVYENMTNGNELIFQLAKKSKGYGKLFSVMNLKPVSYNIENWMIKYGSNNNVAATELVAYTMLSVNLLEYIENNKLPQEDLELFSESFCLMLSEYSLDDISNQIKLCEKFLDIVDKEGKGLYSLYAVISIMYAIDALVFEDGKLNEKEKLKIDKDYKNIIKKCKMICLKPIWTEIIAKELSNIEIEASVLISCVEKNHYKLKKKEFEGMLKRDPNNALLYKYGFSSKNKIIKRSTFKFAIDNLKMDEILSGQDNLKLEDLEYEDIGQVSFFLIIKYITYSDFPKDYKRLSLMALKAPLIETRMSAISNIEEMKEQLEEDDDKLIKEAIEYETISNIKSRLKLLLKDEREKTKKYVEVKSVKIIPHVKDIYISNTVLEGTQNINMSEISESLIEEDIVYLKIDDNEENLINAVTSNGYVIGNIYGSKNIILINLLENGKYLYGIIKSIENDYAEIKISIYLSYKDVLDEISTTLSLLTGEKEGYIQ